jgi:hypothetical protein
MVLPLIRLFQEAVNALLAIRLIAATLPAVHRTGVEEADGQTGRLAFQTGGLR